MTSLPHAKPGQASEPDTDPVGQSADGNGVIAAASEEVLAEPSGTFSDENVREATFHGVRWFGLSQGLVQIVTVASAVILARLISPSDFGRLAVAIVVSEFALMTANESIGTPLVQRPDIQREHLEAATLLGLLIGVGMALITLLAIPIVTTPLFGARTSELFRLFAPEFAVTGLMIVPQARLQRELRFRRIGLSEAIGWLVCAFVSVGLAFLGLGAQAYVLGTLAGVVVMAAGYITGGRPVMPRWRPRQMRELLSFGLPASAAGFAATSYRNIDYMILGIRLPSAIVGYYYRAFTVGVEYERRLSGIVARIAFPVYARTEDPERRLALRLRIVRINVVLVYPMLALFIALAPVLMPWLFGPHWIPAIVPAQILAVAGMASCVRNLHGPTVLAAGRPRLLFVFCMCETLLYGATVWVASYSGLTVVCIAVTGFQLSSLLIAYTVLLRSAVGIRRTQIFRDLGPAVLASALLLVVAMAIRSALATRVPVFVLVVVAGAAGGSVYLLALRVISRESCSDVLLLAGRVLPGLARFVPRMPAMRWRLRQRKPPRTSEPSLSYALNAFARTAIEDAPREVRSALALSEVASRTGAPVCPSPDLPARSGTASPHSVGLQADVNGSRQSRPRPQPARSEAKISIRTDLPEIST